jgi:hypothetical protein
MPILNYTTKVPVDRTVAEITSLLVRKGARSITSEYEEDGRVSAVTFIMRVGGLPTHFKLPSNPEGVAAVMMRDKPRRTQTTSTQYEAKMRLQAEWVSWRILKDWVAAQMALIESGQAEVAQVFMPYATAQDGRTMYELFVENNQKQLGSGAED